MIDVAQNMTSHQYSIENGSFADTETLDNRSYKAKGPLINNPIIDISEQMTYTIKKVDPDRKRTALRGFR